LAKILQQREGGDLPLIELGALLHDVGYHSFHEFNEEKGRLALSGMMDILEIEGGDKERVMLVVEKSKYQGHDTMRPTTIEGQIVQDANLLDSLGAIGLARSFAAGGYLGRNIHDPSTPVRSAVSKMVYQRKKREGTTLNSLHEKALRLPTFMNTTTAKKIAEHKVKQIHEFIAQFKKEWEGGDIAEILTD
jgi:uncharacterized protein